jgi:acetyl esterase/lipase
VPVEEKIANFTMTVNSAPPLSSSRIPIPRPPYDPEILALKDDQSRPIPSTFKQLQDLRNEEPPRDEAIFNDSELLIEQIVIPSPDGDIPAIVLTRKSPASSEKPHPGILFIHGGGRVMGNAYVGLSAMTQTLKKLDAVVISITYRLSPDFPGSAAVEDCYSSLVWMSHNLARFNVDPTRLMIAGVSAGAGLAAGTMLLARDRKGPRVRAQLLVCPMLDDRLTSLSCRQFESVGRGFYSEWGRYAWSCVLDSQLAENDSIYVAPGRAEDLTGLPPAYIDVGSCEPFRDEAIAYAGKLWECGVQADLHIWGGGTHGFDLFLSTKLGDAAIRARNEWMERTLAPE